MNPIDVKVCVFHCRLILSLVVTTELVTSVNTVDRVGSGRKSWSSIVLSMVPVVPRPAPTTLQSVISPHPVKFIVGMMYCNFLKKPKSVLFRGGTEGA